MFIIDKADILTISESNDVHMISMFQQFVADSDKMKKGEPKLSRKMGYISNVRDAKDILEKLYKSRKNYTLNHLIERIKIYNEENFNYDIITIQLKE